MRMQVSWYLSSLRISTLSLISALILSAWRTFRSVKIWMACAWQQPVQPMHWQQGHLMMHLPASRQWRDMLSACLRRWTCCLANHTHHGASRLPSRLPCVSWMQMRSNSINNCGRRYHYLTLMAPCGFAAGNCLPQTPTMRSTQIIMDLLMRRRLSQELTFNGLYSSKQWNVAFTQAAAHGMSAQSTTTPCQTSGVKRLSADTLWLTRCSYCAMPARAIAGRLQAYNLMRILPATLKHHL